jgi:hypothetical protein
MSKSKADLGTEADGITPQAKKRMREMFALELSGAMQKQNNPIHVDIIGDNHDVLLLQLPLMSDAVSDEFLNRPSDDNGNFWNGMRLMNFSQIVFSGDHYRKVVTREEIVSYSKNYDKYKTDYLKMLKGIQAGAQGEVTKP